MTVLPTWLIIELSYFTQMCIDTMAKYTEITRLLWQKCSKRVIQAQHLSNAKRAQAHMDLFLYFCIFSFTSVMTLESVMLVFKANFGCIDYFLLVLVLKISEFGGTCFCNQHMVDIYLPTCM